MNRSSIGKKQQFAILAMSLLVLGPQAISPAMAGLLQAFPTLPTGTVRLVISLPLITLVLCTLFTGLLETRFDKKHIALAGIAIYTVAGVSSVFAGSFAALAVSRLVLGAGLGLFASYGVAFLSMLFEGDERRRLIGLQSTACNVGSLLLTTLAGILTAMGWNRTFWIYCAGFPVFLLVWRYVPAFPPGERSANGREKPKMTRSLWRIAAGNVLFFLVFFLVFSDYSVLIMRSGLGSVTDGSIGLSLLSVAALVTGLLYKQISGTLRGCTAIAGVTATAAGFFAVASAGTLTAASLGAMLIGVGFGIIMPHCYASAAQCTAGSGQSLAAASQTFATNIASFSSSYVLNLLLGIFGGEISEKQIFCAAGIVMTVYVLVLLILALRSRGKN